MIVTVKGKAMKIKVSGTLWVSSFLLAVVLGFEGKGLEAKEAAPPPSSSVEKAGKPASKASGKKAYFLIVDYLSQALYEKEPLTACFRLENTTDSKVSFRVNAKVLGADGKVLRSHKKTIEVKAKALGAYRHDHDLSGAETVEFEFHSLKGSLKKMVVRLLRDGVPWPKTVVRNGRMRIVEDDAYLLPIVGRKKQDEERTWAPLKWALGGKKKRTKLPASALLVCLPGLWAKHGADASKDKDQGGFDAILDPTWQKRASADAICKLGPFPMDGAIPVLKAAAAGLDGLAVNPAKENQKLKKKKHGPFQRAVIMLPSEDLEVSTDPRVYQVILEAWLVRLRGAGIKEVVLFPPFKYGIPLKRQQIIWTAVKAASRVQKAKMESVEALVDEKYWRVDPNQKGVYGTRPNELGQAAIGKALAEWLE